MTRCGNTHSIFSLFALLGLAFFASAESALANKSDSNSSFYGCLYLGNIVRDDMANPSSPNRISFHDGRAMQLYAMGVQPIAPDPTTRNCASGNHTCIYIKRYESQLADMARATPGGTELNQSVDWYDGRVVSLVQPLWCDSTNEYPRYSCSGAGRNSAFPDDAGDPDNVLDRLKKHVRPCCVLSSSTSEIPFFPCQLQ